MANYNLTQTGAQVQALLDTVAAGYIYMGVADLTTTPDTTNPNVCYLLSAVGTYTNFGNITHASGITLAMWNGTAWSAQNVPSSAVVQTDATPTENSTNPVQSGGVYNEINKLDVQVNGGSTYLDYGLSLTANAYYYTGDPILVTPTTYADSGMYCAIVQVQEGDKFKIYGKGNAYATRLYAFGDNSNANIGQADNNVDYRANGYEITAPSGATTLIINFKEYDATKDKLQKYGSTDGLVSDVETLKDEVFGNDGYEDIPGLEITNGAYYNTQAGDEPRHIKITTDSISGYSCCKFSVSPGDKFKIYGEGYSFALKLYAFGDSDLLRLDCADNNLNTRTNGLEITAPANAAWLVVNFKGYDSSTDKLLKWNKDPNAITNRVEALEDEVDVFDDFKPMLQDFCLKGKTIVCFGDSLTEMGDTTNNKSYSDYIEEKSGASVVNVGIGGSQLRKRSTNVFSVFDSSKSYAIGNYCIYTDVNTNETRLYVFTSAHTGAWDANDVSVSPYQSLAYNNLDVYSLIKASCDQSFDDVVAACKVVKETQSDDNTAIIDRLMAIDWTKVDAVTIFAGTNDWATANSLGTTGSTDANKTLGAINDIINILLTTYPNIKLYWFTPVVRWYSGFNVGTNPPTIDDTKFSDNYSVEGNGTLKEECAAIIKEVTNNHIPICDMYNNFGWNKYNCKEFFVGTDGTHPKTEKGVVYLADKILNFIYMNKTF